ncbi:MAG: hypothetical protein K1X72_07585 [Pyrinomonadaceae bacterium]|nr:hypothetical protein [Pyrinomonadaceae bacterium]
MGKRIVAKKEITEPKQLSLTVFLLIMFPIAIALSRFSDTKFSHLLNEEFSLFSLSHHWQQPLEYIVFVAFGAMIVTFSKFTLGINVWGVFRPVLLAIAFKSIGVLPGIIFLAFVLSVNAFIVRPMLKANKTPYFARVSALLSSAVILILVSVFIGKWTGSETLLHFAFFPIIPLCLVTESFAVKTRKEGLRTAFYRISSTVFVAVLITILAKIRFLMNLLMQSPELLISQIGLILLMAQHLNLRLSTKLRQKFQDLNNKKKSLEIIKI